VREIEMSEMGERKRHWGEGDYMRDMREIGVEIER
jgi:hypothetical protein